MTSALLFYPWWTQRGFCNFPALTCVPMSKPRSSEVVRGILGPLSVRVARIDTRIAAQESRPLSGGSFVTEYNMKLF